MTMASPNPHGNTPPGPQLPQGKTLRHRPHLVGSPWRLESARDLLTLPKYLALAMVVGLICGCGDGKARALPEGESSGTQMSGTQKSPVEPGKTVKPIDTAPPRQGPVETVTSMTNALKDHRPDVIWNMLPVRFRDDVESLLHTAAEHLDAVLWERSFATWGKIGQLLVQRGGDLVAHPAWQDLNPTDRDRLRRRLADLGEILQLLARSDLAKIDRVKTLDAGDFLKQTGRPLLERFSGFTRSLGETSLPMLMSELEPRLLSETKDAPTSTSSDGSPAMTTTSTSREPQRATVRIGWFLQNGRQPVSEFMMVNVNGRWMPAGWANAWEAVRQLQAAWQAGNVPEWFTNADERLQAVNQADRIIDQLLQTGSAAELHAEIDRQIPQAIRSQLLALLGSLAEIEASDNLANQLAAGDATDADYVTVVVRGRVVPAAEEAVITALESAIVGDTDAFPQRVGQEFRVRIGPVSDVSAYASRLRLGNVVSVDVEQRRIVLQLPE